MQQTPTGWSSPGMRGGEKQLEQELVGWGQFSIAADRPFSIVSLGTWGQALRTVGIEPGALSPFNQEHCSKE